MAEDEALRDMLNRVIAMQVHQQAINADLLHTLGRIETRLESLGDKFDTLANTITGGFAAMTAQIAQGFTMLNQTLQEGFRQRPNGPMA